MKRMILYISMFGLISACKAESMSRSDTVIYWVNSFKVDCVGAGPMLCLQVQKRDTPTGEWQNFYSQIRGFEYVPGYLYKLTVRETALPPEQVPADASSIRYDLVEVLEKRPDRKLQLHDIWVLEAIEGEDLSNAEVAVLNERPRLEVQISSGKYMGHDGCNEFKGAIYRYSTFYMTLWKLTGVL